METYKADFIELMVRYGVLRFGEFTTKSGRQTPFFINTGAYQTGSQIAKLASFYAQAIQARKALRYDVLYGPAYKGIPLAVSTAMALYNEHQVDVAYCFNRKEAKDHGEGGTLVGHTPKPGERVLIIEDVTTAGTSVRETAAVLKTLSDVKISGLVVSVDRMERGTGAKNALDELRDELGMDAFSIVTIEEVMQHLHNRELDGRVVLNDHMRDAMLAYRAKYGA
jgi:orotate phosphoribosyltransferase